MAALGCIFLQLVDQIGNFVENELLLEQLFLLAVESFLDYADFGIEGLLIGVLPTELSPAVLVLRVFQLPRKFVLLEMHFLDLALQREHLVGILGHLPQPLLRNLDLALILGNFDFDHPDLVLNVFDVHLGSAEDVFLNVGLFVEDAELVVAVDELYAGEVPVFAGEFVLFPQALHILLQGDDDHVEFFDFVGVLVDEFLLLLLLELVLVELGLGLVPLVDLQLQHVVVVLDGLVLLRALVLEDLELVLQDLYALFQLGQVLG